MRQWVLAFGIGLVVGIAGTVLLPSRLSPYLPASWRPAQSLIVGDVFQKVEGEGQVSLLVETEWGALLATFTDEMAEKVRLLVDEGDEIVFALAIYEPFLENPDLAQVLKGGEPESSSPSSGQPG